MMKQKLLKQQYFIDVFNGDCPDYSKDLLTRNIDSGASTRETRYGKLNLICPKYVRELEGRRSFQVSAAKM